MPDKQRPPHVQHSMHFFSSQMTTRSWQPLRFGLKQLENGAKNEEGPGRAKDDDKEKKDGKGNQETKPGKNDESTQDGTPGTSNPRPKANCPRLTQNRYKSSLCHKKKQIVLFNRLLGRLV